MPELDINLVTDEGPLPDALRYAMRTIGAEHRESVHATTVEGCEFCLHADEIVEVDRMRRRGDA